MGTRFKTALNQMANAARSSLDDFDWPRARWMISAFDDACQALPNQPPSDQEREILTAYIIKAAQAWSWDRVKLRDEALAHLRAVAGSE